ncbi:MAG: HAD family hydrolase [Thermoleophilaceae bacterium]|nr:HAD family hydrolase [Thermoleophilaceae bacterium]
MLDALGTLVYLEPPGPRLRGLLAEQGVAVSEEQAQEAIGAEIGYYLAHHMEAGTPEGLEALRDRCAAVISDVLGRRVERETMLAALRFKPFDDVVPALIELRARDLKLVVVSNWDLSLPEWLAEAGLLELVDATASSAVAGAAKPDPAVFHDALAHAGVEPGEALHVGDSYGSDVVGARSAGIEAVLIDRYGEGETHDVRTIASLGEVASLV